ncbi:MAG TPA: hypothetical protein VHT70_00705 [Candidatus Saccharimonadales bacterium]|jgi:hypothetical protein|nr:hypothetical protein [Candidatus Saccharimonadales bacterium]
MQDIRTLREFAAAQTPDLYFQFENGDRCVVLTAPTCDEFHEWHYYLLTNEDGLRVVRRHKIIPDLYPTKIVDCEGDLTEVEKAIIRRVAAEVSKGTLVAMPDCNRTA